MTEHKLIAEVQTAQQTLVYAMQQLAEAARLKSKGGTPDFAPIKTIVDQVAADLTSLTWN